MAAPTPDNVDTQYTWKHVNYDNKRGLGATPMGGNIMYQGCVAWITPTKFLQLAVKADRRADADNIQGLMLGGQAIATPYLVLAYDEDWSSLRVQDHEGRARTVAIREMNGDVPMPVQVTVSGLRARHLDDDFFQAFNVGVQAQGSDNIVRPGSTHFFWQGKNVVTRKEMNVAALATVTAAATGYPESETRELVDRLDDMLSGKTPIASWTRTLNEVGVKTEDFSKLTYKSVDVSVQGKSLVVHWLTQDMPEAGLQAFAKFLRSLVHKFVAKKYTLRVRVTVEERSNPSSKVTATTDMVTAAGVLLLSQGRMLLGLRGPYGPSPNTWAPFGGKVEPGETPEAAARRELYEETGVRLDGIELIEWHVDETPYVRFHLFFATTELMPEVKINHESRGFAWVRNGSIPRPIHPGFARFLEENPTLEEYDPGADDDTIRDRFISAMLHKTEKTVAAPSKVEKFSEASMRDLMKSIGVDSIGKGSEHKSGGDGWYGYATIQRGKSEFDLSFNVRTGEPKPDQFPWIGLKISPSETKWVNENRATLVKLLNFVSKSGRTLE